MSRSRLTLVTKDSPILRNFNLSQLGTHAEFREHDPLSTCKTAPSPNGYYDLEIIESYLGEALSNTANWTTVNIKVNNLPCLCASLKILDLSENNLSDDSILPLSRLLNLQALHLDGNPVTQRCLTTLEELPLLELSLRRTFVADYQDIGTQRKTLGLKFPTTLQRLLLDKSLIEGHTFQTIFKLKNLNTLSILYTPLCDQGVEITFTCPRFFNIKVTKELLERGSMLEKSASRKWTSAAKFTVKK